MKPRERLGLRTSQAEADFDSLPFDAAAARSFGAVAASLRRSGRTPKARAFDALIAAVAQSPPSLHLGPSGPRGSMGSSPYLSSVTMRAYQAHRASIPDSRPP
jgi:hypothetical protein